MQEAKPPERPFDATLRLPIDFDVAALKVDPVGLAAVIAVATTGSIGAGAKSRGYTKGAIHSQIGLVETQLLGALFVRERRGSLLTDRGRRLLPYMAAALRALDRLVRAARGELNVVHDAEEIVDAMALVEAAGWTVSPLQGTLRCSKASNVRPVDLCLTSLREF